MIFTSPRSTCHVCRFPRDDCHELYGQPVCEWCETKEFVAERLKYRLDRQARFRKEGVIE